MTKQQQHRINLADLTLDQLDEAERLTSDGAGRMAAIAHVALRDVLPGAKTVEAAGKLTSRQVLIVEEFDDSTPTTAQS